MYEKSKNSKINYDVSNGDDISKKYENSNYIRNLLAAGAVAVPLIFGGGNALAEGVHEQHEKPDSQTTEQEAGKQVPLAEEKEPKDAIVPEKLRIPQYKFVSEEGEEGGIEPTYKNNGNSTVIRVVGPTRIVEDKIREDYGRKMDPNRIDWANVRIEAGELEDMLKFIEKNNPSFGRKFHEDEYGSIIAKYDEWLKIFNEAIGDKKLTWDELSKLPNLVFPTRLYAKTFDGREVASIHGPFIDFHTKPRSEKPEEEKVEDLEAEISKGLLVHRIGAGLKYHFGSDQLLVPFVEYLAGNDELLIGGRLGYSQGDFEQETVVTTTDPHSITGFYSNNTTKERSEKSVFEALFRMNHSLADWLNFGWGVGFSHLNETTEKDLIAEVLNRYDDVLSRNTGHEIDDESRFRLEALIALGLRTAGKDFKLGFDGEVGGIFDFEDLLRSSFVLGGNVYVYLDPNYLE